jgi:invasion protein IalB
MKTNRPFRRLVGILLLVAWAVLPALAGPAQTSPQAPASQTIQGLPGGATSLQETHGDWKVSCEQQKDRHVCALSQQHTDKETRQLVVAIELSPVAAGKGEGTIILPFGLALEKLVALEIDETVTGPLLPYKTCLPVGCLVSVSFDAATVARLKKAKVLTVRATANGGQVVAFPITLVGFAGAFDRTVSLAKSPKS